MAKFLSGPPGGRTLPQTPSRLSDLSGGIYGPGASVASTGFNTQRPAIKAGIARAAGETWEDVLEYYLVRYNTSENRYTTTKSTSFSSTQIGVRLTLPTVLERSSTKEASMHLQAGSDLVAKALARSHETISLLVNTFSL